MEDGQLVDRHWAVKHLSLEARRRQILFRRGGLRMWILMQVFLALISTDSGTEQLPPAERQSWISIAVRQCIALSFCCQPGCKARWTQTVVNVTILTRPHKESPGHKKVKMAFLFEVLGRVPYWRDERACVVHDWH